MNLEELKQKHLEQWAKFFDDRAKSTHALIIQRVTTDPLTHRFTEHSDAQEEFNTKMDEWSEQWGVNGINQKILCLEQSKDFIKYFQKQALITKMIDAVENQKELTP